MGLLIDCYSGQWMAGARDPQAVGAECCLTQEDVPAGPANSIPAYQSGADHIE